VLNPRQSAREVTEVALMLPQETRIYLLRLNHRPTWPRTDSKVIPAQRLGAAERTSVFAGGFGSGFASAATSGGCFGLSASTFGPALAISCSRLWVAC
jgi:hypothetical protein